MGYNVNKPDPTEVARIYVEYLEAQMTTWDNDPANDLPVADLLAIYDEVKRRVEVHLGPALATFKRADPWVDVFAAPSLPWVAAIYVSMPDPEWFNRFSPNTRIAAQRWFSRVLLPKVLCTSAYYLEKSGWLMRGPASDRTYTEVFWYTYDDYDAFNDGSELTCLTTIDDMDWRTYLDVELGLGPDRLLSLQAYLNPFEHPREALLPGTDSSTSLLAQAFRNALGR